MDSIVFVSQFFFTDASRINRIQERLSNNAIECQNMKLTQICNSEVANRLNAQRLITTSNHQKMKDHLSKLS